jgi:hypothetical protein
MRLLLRQSSAPAHPRVSLRTYAGPDKGVEPVPFLVLLVVAVVVVVLVMRSAAASGGNASGGNRARLRSPRPRPARRPTAPDDDPEFLRELGRRARRDDGSPT